MHKASAMTPPFVSDFLSLHTLILLKFVLILVNFLKVKFLISLVPESMVYKYG